MVQLKIRGRASACALGRTRELLGAVALSLALSSQSLSCRSVAAHATERPVEGPTAQAQPQQPDAEPGGAGVVEQTAQSDSTGNATNVEVELPAAVAPAATPSAPNVTPQEREVRQLLDSFYRDFAAGEWSRVADHFWPGATLVTIRSPSLGAPPTVVVMRIEDYVARQGSAGRAAPLKLDMRTQRIETLGSIGSAVAQYDALDPSGAQTQGWHGADMFSLVLHNGEWRIASLVFEGARFGRP